MNTSVLQIMFFTVMLAVSGTSVSSVCAEQLSGRRAAEYISGFADKFTGRKYSALILERRNRSPETGGMIDALVFIPARGGAQGCTYRFIRRLDEDYVVGLYAAEGREFAAVTAGDIPGYRRMIKGNMMSAFVILDRDGTEEAVVYCGIRPCRIVWNRKRDGEVLLEISGTSKNEGFRGGEFSREGIFK
ncbi:MAG: hypothetical protein PHC33_04265 [Candidatus Omnitrophica bacterium]|nr:hypothetical protein [Candidatus Omnitrophota bacterium]